MSSDINSLLHTKWNCKYHFVFALKYRRQIIYRKIKKDIGQILRQLCERKGVEIIEATACKDHKHMLVSILPKMSVFFRIFRVSKSFSRKENCKSNNLNVIVN